LKEKDVMDYETLEYKGINEVVHCYNHKSGLKAFVIPKKGYSKKFATFATNYGSVNNQFIAPHETNITQVPDGIAHFLEHKLFEQKDGSVMDKFSQLGASPNAYTSFTQTVYLFSCTDKFNENFQLLLTFVQDPYITDESVNKEKGIIGQEIMMYQDNPGWRSFFNLLSAFYKNNPVKIDIAGSIESISRIDKNTLYKCYRTFYHPSNMVICIVGDVEPESVFQQVEQGIAVKDYMPDINRIFPEEPNGIYKHYVEQKLPVSTPMFQVGIKDNVKDISGMEYLQREVAVKLLLESIMGRSSRLYSDLYSEGLINSTFDFDYNIEESFAFSMFGGESPEPLRVKERIIEEIEYTHKNGLNKDNYKRIRKAMYGRFIKQLNSVERISHMFISVYFKEVNLFDYLQVYDKMTFEYVSKVFNEHFNLDNLALSVVKPM
jgi:predicted Zn-dependent peptidase